MQCPCSGDGGANPLLLLAVFAGAWLLFNWIKTLIKSKGVSLMNKTIRILIVIALIVVVGVVIAVKQKDKSAVSSSNSDTAIESNSQTLEKPKNAKTTANLPRLVDLGADKCIPCKMMAPILEGLKKEYQGRMDVVFIDVWKNPDEAKKYGIKIIPAQIFFDALGKELFRHEGFFSKEDILAKWKEFGVTLEKGTNNATN
jgi:thioredoxin 1